VTKAKTPATAVQAARLPIPAPAHTPEVKGRMAMQPSINAASVIEAYQGNVMGKDADINTMIDSLRDTFGEVKGGDLHTMEAMLISQATALQSIFTSLARRAALNMGEHMGAVDTYLRLALKAQSQSRATISALVDLKYPRQATFVAQANIAHGPQQVNNGAAPPVPVTHGKENELAKNKLLEADHGQPGGWVDRGAAATAARGDPAMEAVVKVHRPQEPRG
jgi:hypothetical protein